MWLNDYSTYSAHNFLFPVAMISLIIGELDVNKIMKNSKQKTFYISIKIIFNESNDFKINVHLLTIYNVLVALYFNSKLYKNLYIQLCIRVL